MAGTGETNWPSNCLFHYTDRLGAEAIAENGYFEVGTGAQFGFGLYATDLPPDEASPEEIRAVCFEGDASHSAFNGLIVLLGDSWQAGAVGMGNDGLVLNQLTFVCKVTICL